MTKKKKKEIYKKILNIKTCIKYLLKNKSNVGNYDADNMTLNFSYSYQQTYKHVLEKIL